MVKFEKIETDHVRIDYRISNEPFFGAHLHEDYEMYYHLSGEVIRRFEDREYRPSPKSLLLIPPGVLHEWRILSREPCNRFSIHFSGDLLQREERNMLFTLFLSPRMYDTEGAPVEIGSLIHSLRDCGDMEKGIRNMAVKSRLLSLLTALYKLGDRCTVPSRPVSIDPRIRNILIYLTNNISVHLTLDGLARRFNISKNHLNVLFRRETGTTVIDLFRSMRLSGARQSIRAGLSAAEAAYRVGYNNYAAFFKAYRACFGASPRIVDSIGNL
ncbi:MAG: AraC family transcriptional regulator [Treponema sp.]|jgi:AraC-like DNA-binding protein/mannose-6-phosphate isomerase-like protein (cupin superfamily)|nr:AraC family transcriptional regulator [Treponema sp.]